MSDTPADITMNNLIDRLWGLVVGDPNSGVKGGKSASPTITAVNMCQPGIPILSKDFANMRTEFNPQGDLRPTEAFSNWVDRIPDVSLFRFKPSDKLVSDAYGNLVRSANSNVEEPTEKEKDAYDKARQFLYTAQKNPFTGEEDGTEVETEVYKQYRLKKKKYDTAIEDYISRWSELDLNKIEDQKIWQAEGRRLQRGIDDTWDDWNAAQKNYVEMALDIMGTKMRTLVAGAISDAQKRYEQAGVPSLLGAGDFYPAYTFPHSWWEESAGGWTQFNVKSTYDYLHTESHTKKASANASFLGLWSIGGSGGYSKTTQKEEHESKNIEISMKVATIDVVRPWLRTTWMQCRHWFERGQKKGDVSSGNVATLSNDLLLPLIPMQVIVARDIVLTGDWSKDTREKMEQQISAGASFGYGPFSIGGKYEQSDTEETQTSQFEGNALKVQGMQIIGMVSTCPPPSPPDDDPNA